MGSQTAQAAAIKLMVNQTTIKASDIEKAEVVVADKIDLVERVLNAYFLTGSTFKAAQSCHCSTPEAEEIIKNNLKDEVANKVRLQALQNMYDMQIPINQLLQKAIIKKINSEMRDAAKLEKINIRDLVSAQKNSFQLLAFMKEAQMIVEGKAIGDISLDKTNEMIKKLEEFE